MTTFTPNIGLTIPANGADVGTWDTAAMNPNLTLTDSVVGQITTISLNNSNIVLNAAQMQSRMLVFNSTLTGSVTITFATSFIKDYEILHSCTGSSAFTITLETTSGGQVICASPGEIIDVVNDGSNLKYKNFGRVGSYWDYAGSSVPNWVSGCTVPPYLNCDGTTFSSGTYPVLANVLGGTTLPDSKGRMRLALDQGAGRVSSAVSGFSPTTVGAAGGAQSITIGSSNLPANIPYKDPGHVHTYNQPVFNFDAGTGSFATYSPGSTNTGSATVNITINPSTAAAGTGNAAPSLPPAYVGGLQLIRAA